MKILFIMTHIPDPRINKRIELLKEKNEIEVICVKRKKSDIWDTKFNEIKHNIIEKDVPKSNLFIIRSMFSINFIFEVRKYINKFKPDIIYAEGFEALVASSFLKKEKKYFLIYEVADLRESYLGDGIKNKILNQIARYFYKKINLLILTSEKFYDKYFYKYIENRKVLIIPNVPDQKVFSGFKKENNNKFTVGFIGGIRYLKQIKMLVDVSEEVDVNILLAGAGGTDDEYEEIKKYCNGKKNIKLTGKYNYDKEIKGLYEKVDCIYAVYDSTNPNVKIALPNKLYESIYCELPIIVAKNTYLEEVVNKLGVGIGIDINKKEELKYILSSWKNKEKIYFKYVENCIKNKEKQDIQIYNKRLLKAIEKLNK